MVGAGIYSFLPLGYRVIRKISQIVREEMNAIGGQEFHLPALNPKEIWDETGRVEAFGDILFHIKNREYVLAPTHEEIMTYHARVITSYSIHYTKLYDTKILNKKMFLHYGDLVDTSNLNRLPNPKILLNPFGTCLLVFLQEQNHNFCVV